MTEFWIARNMETFGKMEVYENPKEPIRKEVKLLHNFIVLNYPQL